MIGHAGHKTQDQESGAAPHILLGAVGDIILHKELQKVAFENDFWQRQSYAEIWKDALPLLQFPDLLYGNLEGVVSTVRCPPCDNRFSFLSRNIQSGAAYHSQGFEDKNLGSSPGLLGQ